MAQVLERPVELDTPASPAERTARRKALLEWIAIHSLGIAAASSSPSRSCSCS